MPLMIIKDIVCGQESHEESISVGLIGWKPVQKIQLSISNQEYVSMVVSKVVVEYIRKFTQSSTIRHHNYVLVLTGLWYSSNKCN